MKFEQFFGQSAAQQKFKICLTFLKKIFFLFIITLRSTFYCAIVIYFCHKFFKLNRTFINDLLYFDLFIQTKD